MRIMPSGEVAKDLETRSSDATARNGSAQSRPEARRRSSRLQRTSRRGPGKRRRRRLTDRTRTRKGSACAEFPAHRSRNEPKAAELAAEDQPATTPEACVRLKLVPNRPATVDEGLTDHAEARHRDARHQRPADAILDSLRHAHRKEKAGHSFHLPGPFETRGLLRPHEPDCKCPCPG